MKELIELQENSERQFSELMSKINEQKEYLTKEIEALIETKQELELELKNLVDEIKDEILLFVTTWMDLQSITLGKSEKDKYNNVWFHLYVQYKQNKQTNKTEIDS